MSRKKILIVDDDPADLEIFARILEQKGYQVRTAVGGAEALESLQAEAPDLILSDLTMPGMDGIALLARVKQTHPALPVVLLTGHGTVATAVSAIQQGAFDYIVKPCPLDKICATVAGALARGEGRGFRGR